MTNELDDSVSILMGRVTGLFRGAVNYSVGTGPSSIAVGDFNRDGKLDLAATNRLSSTLTVLSGRGNGTFSGLETFASLGFSSAPSALAVGDLNGDGRIDLIYTDEGMNTVNVMLQAK